MSPAFRKYFTLQMLPILVMGFSSGLPLLLTLGTLQLSIEKAGYSYAVISSLALVRSPYAFKFLWASVVDYFPVPGLGSDEAGFLSARLSLLHYFSF